ncbi:MAG: DEAD/DEAH box helicase [Methylacidiphilales bacterium]|nr:DEAD/DEAH box helicase [Candidatus Methylacidiphilales bacterium]
MTQTQEPTFESLALSEEIQRALREKGYTTPSPIQHQCIPHLLEGKDLLGCAQTGTGKTAAFALPILHRFDQNPKPRIPNSPRALILTPTRELAAQIGASFATYGKHLKLNHAVIFGGVGQNPQVKALQRGIDILVATPGRLLDLQGQGYLKLGHVEVFVLDEADRMLDMGFIHDVRKIMKQLPARRQSLLFSATLPQEIVGLAEGLLHNPVRVDVAPASTTADRIEQKVCFVDKSKKRELLIHLLGKNNGGLALVFSRTKHGANHLAEALNRSRIPAEAIHSNKSQNARQRALESFRSGQVKVLVATDIAARGIDIKGITLVVNFDIPNEPESYVHRIGRTARAGAEGMAISLCSHEERSFLRDIQRLIRLTLPILTDHPFHVERAAETQEIKDVTLSGNKPFRRFNRGFRSRR